MGNAALAVVNGDLEQGYALNERQLQLLKDSILKGASDTEFQMFVAYAESKQLDPFNQIYAVRQGGALRPATTIHGMRAIAARSGDYGPRKGPEWCGPDGKWVDIWLDPEPPAAARVGVRRNSQSEYTYGKAVFREVGAPKAGRGGPWQTMPAHMLAIRAEADALRFVFPEHLSGVYTKEELVEDEGRVQIEAHQRYDWKTGKTEVSATVTELRDEWEQQHPDNEERIIDAETGEILPMFPADDPDDPAINDPMTPAQRQAIMDYIARLKLTKKAAQDWSGEVTGITNANLLRQDQAQELIASFAAEWNRKQKEAPSED